MPVQFMLLGNGEERKHLVPVLKTVLQLSPQEASQLEHIASGETHPHLRVLVNSCDIYVMLISVCATNLEENIN